MVGRPTIRAVNKIGDIEVKVSHDAYSQSLILLLFSPLDLLDLITQIEIRRIYTSM